MAADVLDLVIAREQVQTLRDHGMGSVVDAMMGNDDICRPSRRRNHSTAGQLGKAMGTFQTVARQALTDAREILAAGPTAENGGAGLPPTKARYIDAAEFLKLLRGNVNNRNRRAIAALIYQMAHALGRTLASKKKFWDIHDLEDACSNAAWHAIKKLDNFDRRRVTAFAFFNEIIRKSIFDQMAKNSKRRQRIDSLEKYIDRKIRGKVL